MMIWRAGFLLWAFSLGASAQSGQTISGRVTDSAGIPIPHVRILTYPVGDSTESATRIAFTNAVGEFRVRVDEARMFTVRVRRIGFAAPQDHVVDLTQEQTATLVIALRWIPVPLASVRVKPVERRCLAWNDPQQTPVVRTWLDQAFSLIFARRVAERDYSFKIDATWASTPAGRGPPSMRYTHQPGATSRDWIEDDPANLASIARAAVLRASTGILPSEATLLYPTFRTNYCFETVIDQHSDGSSQLRFHDIGDRASDPAISGVLTFAQDGSAITRADFTFRDGGRVAGTAHVEFANIELEGESFPIVVSRGVSQQTTKVQTTPSSLEQRLVYSAFAKAK